MKRLDATLSMCHEVDPTAQTSKSSQSLTTFVVFDVKRETYMMPNSPWSLDGWGAAVRFRLPLARNTRTSMSPPPCAVVGRYLGSC